MSFHAYDEPLTDQKVALDVTEGPAYTYGTPHLAPEDPFGNITAATGPMAYVNPFRFSTKYSDFESGLDYYGYRFYAPGIGRWFGRDPVEDRFNYPHLPRKMPPIFKRSLAHGILRGKRR